MHSWRMKKKMLVSVSKINKGETSDGLRLKLSFNLLLNFFYPS